MKREIYKDSLSFGDFAKVMKRVATSYDDVKRIDEPSHYQNGSQNFYSFDGQNVILRGTFPRNGDTTIDLFGREGDVGRVEVMVLAEIEKE